MGNIGGIEKIMVFGILVIIVVILGIAFYSAVKVDDDLTPNRLKAAGGSDKFIRLLDDVAKNDVKENPNKGSGKRTFKDVNVRKSQGAPQNASLKKNETIKEDRGPVGQGAKEAEVAGSEKPAAVVEKPKKERLIKNYKIKPGDTLMQIARVLYGDERKWQDIMNVNPALDPSNLQVGQVIKLPKPISAVTGAAVKKDDEKPARIKAGERSYIVQSGDNLAKISERFYGSAAQWKKIWEANRDVISDPDVLKVGVELYIP